MADNTQLNIGTSGDTIRDLDRTGTGAPKTEVTQLDLGGPAANREFLPQGTVPVSLDNVQFDDDGNPLVAIAPSADIATASLQLQIIAANNGALLTPGPATSVTVGVSSVQILPANLRRQGLVLTNVSTGGQRIALSLGLAAAVLDTGIELWPGDVWEMDRYTFGTFAIQGIASAASGSMAVQEFST